MPVLGVDCAFRLDDLQKIRWHSFVKTRHEFSVASFVTTDLSTFAVSNETLPVVPK